MDDLGARELGYIQALMELEAKNRRMRQALSLINDRASYSLGVTDAWLVEVTSEALRESE